MKKGSEKGPFLFAGSHKERYPYILKKLEDSSLIFYTLTTGFLVVPIEKNGLYVIIHYV